MTTVQSPATQNGNRTRRVRPLSEVLRETGSEVTEVERRAGTASGWQLRLATPDGSARWTVLVEADAASAADILAEADLITALRARARPAFRFTLPEPVCLVEVGSRTGVLLLELPGSPMLTGPAPIDPELHVVREHFDQALGWLRTLWTTTEGDFALIRYGENSRTADLPESVANRVAGSLQRLNSQYARRSSVHGSTSPATLRIAGSAVVGVDDWRRAALSGDPVEDLVGFAIRYAPQSLAEIASTEHTEYADVVRSYLCVGLDVLGVDPAQWLDLLIVGSAEAITNELAAVADGAREFLLRLTP
jgi:hypothetical protein